MLKKRIIPCLDIMNGRTVKGVNFRGLQDSGDPLELSKKYVEQGADELVFLDITATIENRQAWLTLVRQIARHLNLPFTVGGGISHVEDARQLIHAGADKISVNTAAVQSPALITELAREFGSQCIVVAIDAGFIDGQWRVFTHGGRRVTSLPVVTWAREVAQRGAGEILLTSMAHDGTKGGFALELTSRVAAAVHLPVIASGGAGSKAHFATLFQQTTATGALAASIFHFGEVSIPTLKSYLHKHKIPVRL